MSSPDVLIQATINCIAARVGTGFFDKFLNLASQAQKVPNKIQEEWDSFKKEIEFEIERIDKDKNSSESEDDEWNESTDSIANKTYIEQLDRIREKVSQLNNKVEEIP